jgi:hypothetical protein
VIEIDDEADRPAAQETELDPERAAEADTFPRQ